MANFNTQPISQLTLASALNASDVFPIVDVVDHTQSPSGTTKKVTLTQLQNFLSTFPDSNKVSCKVVSTSNLVSVYNNGTAGIGATLTNNTTLAALVIDGITLNVNDRVLIQNQSSAFENGIYVVTVAGNGTTAWVLTRASDYNGSTGAAIAQGDFVIVSLGTTHALTLWVQTAAGPFTIGSTSITFSTAGSGSVTSVIGTANQITVTNPTTTPTISISNTYAGQSSITTLGTIATGVWNGTNIPLSHGGTNANLTASNGGIFYSTASAGAILAGTATSNQILLSGSATAPAWSTATYPPTTTINQILYSSSTNVVSGLATGNNGVLVTSAGGVPSISTTLPLAVQGNITSLGSSSGVTVNGNLFLLAGLQLEITFTATSYSTTTTDTIIAVTDTSIARTITLPAAASPNKNIIYIVKDQSGGAGTNHITLNVTGGGNIDGSSTLVISTNYGIARVYSDGTHWYSW